MRRGRLGRRTWWICCVGDVTSFVTSLVRGGVGSFELRAPGSEVAATKIC